jgi:hypothetical protein
MVPRGAHDDIFGAASQMDLRQGLTSDYRPSARVGIFMRRKCCWKNRIVDLTGARRLYRTHGLRESPFCQQGDSDAFRRLNFPCFSAIFRQLR